VKVLLYGLLICAVLWSQHWVNPNVEGHRLDLRDLGYPEVNQIPANSSAITSLLAASNRKIYGGTSGDDAYLFLYDSSINKVRHLGKIPGQEGIHHALVEGYDGLIYVGSGRNVLRPVELSKKILPGSHGADRKLWNDIKAAYAGYAGGHLYRYDPAADKNVLLPADKCPVEDLGIPLAGNGVYALTTSPDRRILYGITYPDGHLFVYDIAARKLRDVGEIDNQISHHGPERDWRSLPRALACDQSGRVYTSGPGGRLIFCDPEGGRIRSTGWPIPGEYYPVQAYTGHPVLDCIAKAQNGLIYGGSSDGFLFVFDPAKSKLINLGKPRVSRRLRGLTVGANGLIYLVAGERDEPCRLYSYDPSGNGFRDLGILAVDRSPYYSWRGYQFDSITTGPDGTIYLGESERRSHLFLYVP
jgi:hypothetical protein